MWVDKKRSWIGTVVLGGFALPKIWWRTLAVTALSVVVTIAYEQFPSMHYSLGAAPFTLVGLPLGIFLGFRNNAAYDRFWEGRKLWGALVNTSRSLTRQLLILVRAPNEPAERADAGDAGDPGDAGAPPTSQAAAFRRRAVHHVIAFPHALRHHLRGSSPDDSLRAVLGDDAEAVLGQDNVPYAVLQRLGELAAEAYRRRWVEAIHLPVLEASLTQLTDIQGACERIKSTPIPYSYSVLMHRIVAFYCTLLPFGLMDAIKWATPAVVLAISYCFFGLDAIGDEIEQPFGSDVNDLPLAAISRTIERNLRERLGEKLPPPHSAKRGVLT